MCPLFTSFLLYFSLFFSALTSFSPFFLFSFSWNKYFHAVYVITNGILSICYYKRYPVCISLKLLFVVCKASWKGEMCLSLSLFSVPVCKAAPVPRFASIVLVVISAKSRSNICLFTFVTELYFLILHYCTVVTWKFLLVS